MLNIFRWSNFGCIYIYNISSWWIESMPGLYPFFYLCHLLNYLIQLSSFLFLIFLLSYFNVLLFSFILLIFYFSVMFINLLFFLLFIYFIYGFVGSSFLCEGSLQLRQVGATLHRSARASHHHGFSCCGAQAPDAQAQ